MKMEKKFVQTMKDKASYFTEEQIERMLNNAPSEHLWLLVFLLSRTGRRISEVLQLKPEHIDNDKCLIRWVILKKRQAVEAWKPIDNKTLRVLNEFIYKHRIPPHEYVFKSNRLNKDNETTHYTRKWAFDNIRKLTKKCDIKFTGSKEIKEYERNGVTIKCKPGWHPHHFRHSFSIHFLSKADSPAALRILQQQLGHSSINVTSAYLEFSPKEQLELLNKVFGGDEE
jgi:integrase